MDLPAHRPSKAYQSETLSGLGITRIQSSRRQQAVAYPEADFEAWLADLKGRAGAFPTSAALRNPAKVARAKAANAELRGDTAADLAALAESGRTFAAILTDFPCRYRTWSDAGAGRSAEMHYRTMDLAEILAMALLIQRLAAKDTALFLWVAWPHLLEAAQVIEACGFRFSTCAFDWARRTQSGGGRHMGLGKWTRANTEPCLIATRGLPPCFDADVPMLVEAPVGRHSEKPAEVHARIERPVSGPYLELFVRQPRPGWMVWGNEVVA